MPSTTAAAPRGRQSCQPRLRRGITDMKVPGARRGRCIRLMLVWTFAFLILPGLPAQTGMSAAAQKPPKAARDAFEKAAKAAQDKKTDEAIRNYQKAVALYPEYAEAWCELGKLQLAQNQLDEARSSLGAAIKANPDYVEPYKALVVLENKAKNWKELVNITSRLLK